MNSRLYKVVRINTSDNEQVQEVIANTVIIEDYILKFYDDRGRLVQAYASWSYFYAV